MLPRERLAQYGEIRDYLPNRYAGDRAVDLPSDDTQLAFWMLEHLLDRGRIEPDALTAPPAPKWWIDTFVQRARPIEGDATVYRPRGDRTAKLGPLWKLVDEKLRHSLQSRRPEAGGEWYSGAYLLETVPAALRVLMYYGADPEEAIVRAVNDTKDNDTIAAIVGAAVGALHGESALPRRWRDGLSGRVVADVDDRKVFELLERAVLTPAPNSERGRGTPAQRST
jgi:ADP-ribosylglycohydrolase